MTMAIRGVITTRHLLTHSGLILRHFGPRAWLRCWSAVLLRRETTFLALAVSPRNA
jgi:hypothetical protein